MAYQYHVPHVQSVIAWCAQALYALHVLRAHGLSDSALQTTFRAVVVAKLTYASSAWLGFTTAHDRQRIDAFMGRSKRAGFCATELDDFDTLCTSTDNQLFLKVLHNPDHVLHSLSDSCQLPPPNVQNYNLRRRTHNIQLPERSSSLIDCNFIIRLLYRDVYWLLFHLSVCFILSCYVWVLSHFQ